MAKKRSVLLLFVLFLFFSGCRVSAEGPSDLHIVTRIDVLYHQKQQDVSRHYTTPAKMESILNYLRLLEYAGIPDEDPELSEGDVCRIDVQLVNGKRHVYYLYANRYLSKDFRPWVQVDADRSVLSVLKLLPNDL